MPDYLICKTEAAKGYKLLDSGNGEKLERYGEVVVARPDPQALWQKRLPESEWQKADAYFGKEQLAATSPNPSLVRMGSDRGEWQTRKKLPERWPIEFGGLKFWIKLSAFKHTGIFPEQVSNWEWMRTVIARRVATKQSLGNEGIAALRKDGARNDNEVRVLNLFGYTGGASMACAEAGASVVHVDGSKSAIGWGRDNAELSGLSGKPIRWILDDAAAFVKREIKRGNKYDGIIMDPPAFGHGPNRELWKIEDHFLPLLENCKQILSEQPLFFLINGYASGYSALAYKNSLGDLLKGLSNSEKNNIEIGELTIEESEGGRLLPAGIFARWSA